MFYLVGTGINNWKDISLNGLNILKKSNLIFIERYTSILSNDDLLELSNTINKKIIELDREDLESNFYDKVLKFAKEKDVVLLIVGDPLTATTHIEFLRECKEKNINFKVIHASSIFSSVCETGLHVYKFGKSCSIPFFEKNFTPTSFFNVIENNFKNNSHTLVFLDIKKHLNKYMTISQGLQRLLLISKGKKSFFNENTLVIGISRLGSDSQEIKFGTVKEILKYNFGNNPHIIIIPKLGSIEQEYVSYLYSLK